MNLPHPTPVQLRANGLTDLVSIIPPGATLNSRSRIKPDKLGKLPGRLLPDGSWVGYNMLKYTPTQEEFEQWPSWGGGIGILTARFPAIDIDCTDQQLSDMITREVHAALGPAPVRTGRAPKQLLLYKTDTPFPKKFLTVWRDGARHLVEILGNGRMCVISGVHPGTMREYSWDRPLEAITADSLTTIDEAAVDALLTRLREKLTEMGCQCDSPTNTARADRPHPEQSGLEAPSIDALRKAVACIPNGRDFPARGDMIEMGIAIKAASRQDWATGLEIYLDWTARWEDGYNDPEETIRDWQSFHPPFRRGWDWIAAIAQQHGFNAAAFDFTVLPTTNTGEASPARAPKYSEQDLAARFVKRHLGTIRSLPHNKSWHIWDGMRWKHDALLVVRDMVKEFLRQEADRYLRQPPAESKATIKGAQDLCRAKTVTAVLELARCDQQVAISPDQFDTDPWTINTHSGIVDLRTGDIREHDPAGLMAKVTSATVGSSAACPRWLQFLVEATSNDPELIAYLQRLAGYFLTGVTREHAFVFLYGPGGNGKSVFLDTLLYVMGDYGKTAPMSIFLAGGHNEHPTELAGLQGARLVAANETNTRGVWNEARLKGLSAGDKIAARYMRGDYFEFTPVLKLLLIGNNKPSFPGVDEAMRRRLHLVSFNFKPPVPDRELVEKLKAEAPGILAWMIEGCLAYGAQGLNPPAIVLKATREYLDDQDPLGRWLSEECNVGPSYQALTAQLYTSYGDWCESSREAPLSQRQFVLRLKERGFAGYQDSKANGLRGLQGLELREFGTPPEGARQPPAEAA